MPVPRVYDTPPQPLNYHTHKRCDCGCVAVVRVEVTVITATGKRNVGPMYLCAGCLAEFVALESVDVSCPIEPGA